MKFFFSDHSHFVPSSLAVGEDRGKHVKCVHVNWSWPDCMDWLAGPAHATSGLIAIVKRPIKLVYRVIVGCPIWSPPSSP